MTDDYQKLRNWRHSTKQMLVDALGGKCNKCGYNKALCSLHFHHLDPTTKLYNIADLLSKPKATDIIVQEAKKCIVLCAICHVEYHKDMWHIDEIQIKSFDETKIHWWLRTHREGICLTCDNTFIKQFEHTEYCSPECGRNTPKRRKCKDKPDKETLESMVWNIPTTKIAEIYNVSDKAVSKWCIKYGITKPGRGYWSSQ